MRSFVALVTSFYFLSSNHTAAQPCPGDVNIVMIVLSRDTSHTRHGRLHRCRRSRRGRLRCHRRSDVSDRDEYRRR
ncbi:Hypothetical predicted protein [Octopus vulgaris]|uniref:Secreted protein n=1 Tax=Octopus vulgaris TaxID=6645 RepID=A0AA36FDM9_OCTVU|nr:Hypothetical predicted protein [Octopus vulgaris]